MITLRNVLTQSEKDGVAVGHFNVATFEMLKAVFNAAAEANVPVLVGASEGERESLGIRQLAVCSKACAKNVIWPHFSTRIIPIRWRRPWKRRKLALMRS